MKIRSSTSSWLALLTLLFSFPIFAQETHFDRLQQYASKDIIANNIKSITGYEFHYHEELEVPDSLVTAGTINSFEAFDRHGRLIEKVKYHTYADFDDSRKLYSYDSMGNVVQYQLFSGDSLERTEYLKYNALNNVVDWFIDFTDKDFGDVRKTVEYVNNDIPVESHIKQRDFVIARDSIHTYYDVYGRPLVELTFDEEGSLRDSVIHRYNLGDTIHLQEVYFEHKLEYKNYLIQLYDLYYFRTEEYDHGRFIGVTYKMFNTDGNIVKDKRIHHFPEMNYEIRYQYNPQRELIGKQVFRNRMEPEFVVKYDIEYYEDMP